MKKKTNIFSKADELTNIVKYANNLKISLIKQDKDIKKIINKIYQTLKKEKKFLYAVMVAQLQMLNIWQQNF